MKYAEKLKDPRWQKKRLEVLERDNWCCQKCYDASTMLCVHHLRYLQGKDPWEYPANLLLTLCQSCHEEENETRQNHESDLLEIIKEKGFLSDDVYSLAAGFLSLQIILFPGYTASLIEFILRDESLMKFADLEFQEHLSDKKIKVSK